MYAYYANIAYMYYAAYTHDADAIDHAGRHVSRVGHRRDGIVAGIGFDGQVGGGSEIDSDGRFVTGSILYISSAHSVDSHIDHMFYEYYYKLTSHTLQRSSLIW